MRFGMSASALFVVITTDASCGAVNAMHDSLMPIAGMIPMLNIQLGEVIFGGVGAGLYGMLMFAILAVFIAGLMVGRTPEYLGKKIESFEMKMAMLAVLILAADILLFHRREQRRRLGHRDDQQPGSARLLRDPVRLHVGHRQQRLGVRRAGRQHALLQHHTRAGHADRTLPDDRALAGNRRLDGAKAARACQPGHVPDVRRTVGRPADRDDADCRRADVFPCPGARSNRGSAAVERRPHREAESRKR